TLSVSSCALAWSRSRRRISMSWRVAKRHCSANNVRLTPSSGGSGHVAISRKYLVLIKRRLDGAIKPNWCNLALIWRAIVERWSTICARVVGSAPASVEQLNGQPLGVAAIRFDLIVRRHGNGRRIDHDVGDPHLGERPMPYKGRKPRRVGRS